MNAAHFRRWFPWVFLGALLAFSLWWGRPIEESTSRLDGLPPRGPAFNSIDLPLTGPEQEFFQGARVVKRQYQLPGDRGSFVLIAIEGRKNRSAVHDPSFCFRGAGWQTGATRPVALDRGTGQGLDLHKEGAQTSALYWFTDGSRQHASAARLWWQSALHRLTRGHSPEPVLVLLQPSSGGGTLNPEEIFRWMPALRQF
jgi:hypothetical protein